MSCSWTNSQRILISGVGIGTALGLGCASPGPPRPPSLHLPDFASKLQAQRVGDEVRLTWVTSTKTTDGDAVRGTMTAVICRESSRNDATAKRVSPCDAVERVIVTPGTTEVTDVLPTRLSTGLTTLLAYRIDLLNDGDRSAGKSAPVFAAGGTAPAPVAGVTISTRRGAALIEWHPQLEVYTQGTRMEVRRTPAAPVISAGQATSQRGTPPVVPTHPVQRVLQPQAHTSGRGSKEPVGEVILAAEAKDEDSADHVDAGGMLDATVRDLNSYVYVAQRVSRVIVEGHDLEIRGVASPPVAFAYRDIFPPRVPSGLMSIAGAGFAGPPSIDLSWEPNAESDLASYNVYRRTGSGAFAKLNAEPIPSSSFRDTQIVRGTTYGYRVTAIDRKGNESAPSSEIHESLRQ